MINMLLIESNHMKIDRICGALSLKDFKIDICSTTNSASHYYSKFYYELFAINANLPGRNLYEMALEIKTLYKTATLIIYGHHISDLDYRMYLEMGADLVFRESIESSKKLYHFFEHMGQYKDYLSPASLSDNMAYSLMVQDYILHLLFIDGVTLDLETMSNIIYYIKEKDYHQPLYVDLSNISRLTDEALKFSLEYIPHLSVDTLAFFSPPKSKGELYANILVHSLSPKKNVHFFNNKLDAIAWLKNNRG